MAKRVSAVKDKDRARPAHSGFEAPMYGEVLREGTIFEDADGNTCVVTNNGIKVIDKH